MNEILFVQIQKNPNTYISYVVGKETNCMEIKHLVKMEKPKYCHNLQMSLILLGSDLYWSFTNDKLLL